MRVLGQGEGERDYEKKKNYKMGAKPCGVHHFATLGKGRNRGDDLEVFVQTKQVRY